MFNWFKTIGKNKTSQILLSQYDDVTSVVTTFWLIFLCFCDSTILYVSFTLVLGATCVRVYLIDDVMIAEKVSAISHNTALLGIRHKTRT